MEYFIWADATTPWYEEEYGYQYWIAYDNPYILYSPSACYMIVI